MELWESQIIPKERMRPRDHAFGDLAFGPVPPLHPAAARTRPHPLPLRHPRHEHRGSQLAAISAALPRVHRIVTASS